MRILQVPALERPGFTQLLWIHSGDNSCLLPWSRTPRRRCSSPVDLAI